ncbi:MAG: hypothetical protein M1820_000966 [Bogoriella megaspora]|nr:MAG: hypothetical protein M1820_000966 [Bogoriella megaspora]
MLVLGYLLPAALSALPEDGCHHLKTGILFGGRKTDESDEQYLQRFSKILIDLPREATFDALNKSLPFRWFPDEHPGAYDVLNPFGDRREIQYDALWTFDTQNDVLRYTNRNRCSQIRLGLLRERTVSLEDMELLGGSVPVPAEPTFESEMPRWKPQIKVDDRIRAFTHRLLRDFNHQWRHILRNPFNSVTLRVLARAIIRLSTLDFEIRQNRGGHGHRGAHVWIAQLPPWEPFETEVVRVGNVCIVLCQAIQEGLSIVRQKASSQQFSRTESLQTTGSGEAQAHYMILTVKHIMLFRVIGPNLLEYTAPEPLFNGDHGTPSDLALDYLIWATASARPSIRTPLQLLPTELQDMVLNHVSAGTVEAAKVGCLLGVASPFSWKDGSLVVMLTERYHTRPSGSSVESVIWFDDQKSGIVYLARVPRQGEV